MHSSSSTSREHAYHIGSDGAPDSFACIHIHSFIYLLHSLIYRRAREYIGKLMMMIQFINHANAMLSVHRRAHNQTTTT